MYPCRAPAVKVNSGPCNSWFGLPSQGETHHTTGPKHLNSPGFLCMAENHERVNGFAMAVVVEGGLAIVAAALAWLFSVPLREQIPQPGTSLLLAVGRGILVTLPMLAVFYWLVHSSRATLRQLRHQVESLINDMFPAASLGQFGLVAVLAGVGEELLFRGVLQNLLGQWTTPLGGLVIASLLFGVAHALSKLYFLLAFLIGLCFGWLVLRYNDLVAPMVAHTLYDFVALVYISRNAKRLQLSEENAPLP
jgi:membrane protease YdiL (CAAX protease family)